MVAEEFVGRKILLIEPVDLDEWLKLVRLLQGCLVPQHSGRIGQRRFFLDDVQMVLLVAVFLVLEDADFLAYRHGAAAELGSLGVCRESSYHEVPMGFQAMKLGSSDQSSGLAVIAQ